MIVGTFQVILFAFNLAKFVYDNWIRKEENLIERYGKGSWVCVTGATSGIGLTFCNQMAKRGFNILLVSRTESKLQECAETISKEHKGIETDYVVADFAGNTDLDFYMRITKEIMEKTSEDLSVLFSNAGTGIGDRFENNDPQEIKNLLDVNVMHPLMLTRSLLPMMLKRSNRSAIITNASASSRSAFPYIAVYAASKAFADFLTRALSYEVEGKMDVLSLNPGFVSTTMTKNKKVGGDTISTDECCEATLKFLTHTNYTSGGMIHNLIGAITSSVWLNFPEKNMKYVADMMKDALLKKKKVEEREKKDE